MKTGFHSESPLTFCTNLSPNSISLPVPQSGIAPVPPSRLIEVPTFWIYDARGEGRLSGDTARGHPAPLLGPVEKGWRRAGSRASDAPSLGTALDRPHLTAPAPPPLRPQPAPPSAAPALPSPRAQD